MQRHRGRKSGKAMKKILVTVFLFLVLNTFILTSSTMAEEVMSLTIIDQNFNSTERIVIDQEAIKRSRASSLAQVLSSQANIVITSSNFQPNSVFVRGGDSSHVLFVVDDVPTYDASTLQKTVNLSGMNVSNIKRIEVLKGSQSVLYGGQALSAVIKIYTIPTEFKNSAKAIIQGGTNVLRFDQTIGDQDFVKVGDAYKIGGASVGEAAAGLDHLVSENLLLSLSAKLKDAKKTSPVLDSIEKYPQQTTTGDLSLAYKIDALTRAILKLSYLQDINFVPTTVQPDVKAVDTKDFKFGTRSFGTTAILKKSDTFSVSISSQKNGRQLFQEAVNSPINSKTDFDYTSDLLNSRIEYFFPQHPIFSGLLGTSFSLESFEEVDLNTNAKAKGSNQYQGTFTKVGVKAIPEVLLVEAGYRREDGLDAYQAGLTLWKDLKLEYSTGFKAPSLSQLYSAMYGNPNLKPEKSVTVNLSYEKKITDDVMTSLSLFDSNYKNLFVFIGTKYENIATSRTKGAEVSFNFSNQDYGMNYQVFFAYQEPYDSSTRTWLVKRPLRSAGAKLTHFFNGEQVSLSLEVNHIGERRDRQTSSKYVTVNPYTVADISGNYKLTSSTEAFARIDNVTNQTYQQGYGYYETGLKGRVGLQIGY